MAKNFVAKTGYENLQLFDHSGCRESIYAKILSLRSDVASMHPISVMDCLRMFYLSQLCLMTLYE